MNTLRYANELRAADGFGLPSKDLKAVSIIPGKSDMVRFLADKMSDTWKPEELHDTCHEDLMVLIEKPIQTGQTEVATEPFA